MSRFKVGVQLWPQHTTALALREAWKAADDMGVDSIWVWDHFFPLFGEPEGTHFEGWTLLAAMAADTTSAQIGTLVSCTAYRNPDLLADMARTVDHLSDGRAYLGVGAGWFDRDHEEYGYEFGTAGSRLSAFEGALARIRSRLDELSPPPVGELPILVGGSGEKVTLRVVAMHADAWNTFGPPESWSHKNKVLDRWCEEVGRDPAEIERTVALNDANELSRLDDFLEAGAQHVILGRGDPFNLDPVQRLIDEARR